MISCVNMEKFSLHMEAVCFHLLIVYLFLPVHMGLILLVLLYECIIFSYNHLFIHSFSVYRVPTPCQALFYMWFNKTHIVRALMEPRVQKVERQTSKINIYFGNYFREIKQVLQI